MQSLCLINGKPPVKPTTLKHDKNPQRRRAVATATKKRIACICKMGKYTETSSPPKLRTNIMKHVTMLTRAICMYLYVRFTANLCTCFTRTVTIAPPPPQLQSLLLATLRYRFQYTRCDTHWSYRHQTQHIFVRQQQHKYKKIQNINQSNNQSFNQSSEKKVCLNGFNFFFSYAPSFASVWLRLPFGAVP